VTQGPGHFKDQILDRLATASNVAQFVSFGPDGVQRYAWIRGCAPNARFPSAETAVAALQAVSPGGSVNIRSFDPQQPKSREFIYGLTRLDDVTAAVRRLAGQGLHTIVNETIDVADGGISGVAYGDLVEFAPEDTPRAVEKPGTASLPRALTVALIETVYGFRPEWPPDVDLRVEFSVHPLRRGFHLRHTVIWETEAAGAPPGSPAITWPNRFSRFIGDKVFGLLIGHLVGLRVPSTIVIPRRLAPFAFGMDTGLAEPWIRTAPTEQMPGRFTTRHGWLDPFELLKREDPEGTMIASVLSQRGVDAQASGAIIAQADGQPLLEGVTGEGDQFMVGERAPEPLPARIVADVLATYADASARLGPVRFEWVHDGRDVWIVQLHRGASHSTGRVIYPGEARQFHPFEVDGGIEALRRLVGDLRDTGDGIVLLGRVGVTSHLGDILRRARIPSRIEDPLSHS
jgi:hypothetical protein